MRLFLSQISGECCNPGALPSAGLHCSPCSCWAVIAQTVGAGISGTVEAFIAQTVGAGISGTVEAVIAQTVGPGISGTVEAVIAQTVGAGISGTVEAVISLGWLRGISRGRSPREIPRSSPASPRKTLTIPTLLSGFKIGRFGEISDLFKY